jgi:hypothetical protein
MGALSQISGDVTHDTADVAGLVLRTLSLGLLAGTAVVVGGLAWLGWFFRGLRLFGGFGLLRIFRSVTTVVVDGVSSLASESGNRWARELVLEARVESIDQDAGIGILVGTGHADKLVGGRNTSFITSNLELSTRRVELGSLGLVGNVQRDHLVQDHVVARGKSGGDLSGASLANEGITSLGPLAVLETVLTDLEPFGLGGIKLGAVLVAARSHVGELASGVVWPFLTWRGNPVEGKVAAGLGSSTETGGLSTRTAVESSAVGTVGRVDASDLSDDRVLGTFAGVGAVVTFAVDFDEVDEAVGSSQRGESESGGGEKGERLHCKWWCERGCGWWLEGRRDRSAKVSESRRESER